MIEKPDLILNMIKKINFFTNILKIKSDFLFIFWKLNLFSIFVIYILKIKSDFFKVEYIEELLYWLKYRRHVF